MEVDRNESKNVLIQNAEKSFLSDYSQQNDLFILLLLLLLLLMLPNVGTVQRKKFLCVPENDKFTKLISHAVCVKKSSIVQIKWCKLLILGRREGTFLFSFFFLIASSCNEKNVFFSLGY